MLYVDIGSLWVFIHRANGKIHPCWAKHSYQHQCSWQASKLPNVRTGIINVWELGGSPHCQKAHSLGGRSLTTLAKFCPILTTYLQLTSVKEFLYFYKETIDIMAIRVVEFSNGGTKLERFLTKNQHT